MGMSCLDCHDYMDGYNRGKKEGTIEELEKIKEKMELIHDRYKINFQGHSMSVAKDCIEIIDERISELKGDK